jgi:hypothetical protein
MTGRERADVLPRSLPPRGLRRIEAAGYVGVSPSLFDQMVVDGRMPSPKLNRRVWDRFGLDEAFDALPDRDAGNCARRIRSGISSTSRLACASFGASRARHHHIRLGPVLQIKEWIAPDRDLGIGLGDLADLPECGKYWRTGARSSSAESPWGEVIFLLSTLNPERGCSRVVLKMSISIVVEGVNYP